MAEIHITIKKADVLAEANKTSAYIGAKSQDASTYGRVALVRANEEQLERFWLEACALASGALEPWLTTDASGSASLDMTLRVSSSWNSALQPGFTATLRSSLVNSVLSQWLLIAEASLSGGYSEIAAGMLSDAVSKLHRLTAPVRPT